ncbi:MAG: thiamine-phosphate synthase [Planctomycetota bacterium]|nr:MAG: thiamine-phosphate synthase [Planctomycetota bacterium]
MAESLARRLRLVLVTPGDRAPGDTQRLIAECVEGGVTAVWLREPQLEQTARRELYARVLPALREAGVFSLLSHEPALAAELGADAVQLGHASPTLSDARAAFPRGLVGRSAHWPLCEQDRDADLLTLSPFAATPHSHPRALLSVEQIRAALDELAPRPVIALGGQDLNSVSRLPSGVAGMAVKRALGDAPDPRGRAAQLRSLLDAHFDFGGAQEFGT